MPRDIQERYEKYVAQNRRRNVLKKVVNVLACTVIFCTTYALILPAITMENEVFCGLEEHVHSETCYAQASQSLLTCSADNLDIHTHGNSCHNAQGDLVCGQADYVAHSHDVRCFDAQENLVCTIPERSAHVHSDSCFAPGETQAPVFHVHSDGCNTLQKSDLICTEEEYEGHTHIDACYTPGTELLCSIEANHVHVEACYTYPLICEVSTTPHSHTGGCYSTGDLVCTTTEDHVHGESCMESSLNCENAEEGHIHIDGCYTRSINCSIPEQHRHGGSCYASALTCEKQEGESHSHASECYSAEADLICETVENHTHSDSCYKPELTCTIAEDPGHRHGDDCYSWETAIVCGLEEGQPEPTEPAEPILVCIEPIAQVHIHGDGCFETTVSEAEPICGNTALDHVHSADCYTLNCAMDTHTHSIACYSDPEADVETAEIWEASFAHVELTGKWHEDVIAIAESQLGYTESSRNYAVWEDETTHGYTRYGDWYGSPYGDWCAMFVSFCLNYAEVEGMPLHWGVRPWIEELTDLKLYHEADVYDPKPGDIVFYDWEGDNLSDHVGLVAEIIPATDVECAKVKAIEGNSSNRVQYVYYDFDDEQILGYSELPDNIEVYSCGILRHSHNEYCYDEAGNFICQQFEHTHTDTCEPRDTVYCGMEEHVHGEGCFDEENNLICELTEHTHNESCIVENPVVEIPVYFCGQEEHTHDDACYDEAGELICDISEHIHSEECTVEPATYYCGLEEHTHNETCYDEAGELICEIIEHTHSEECTVEPVTYYCGMDEHTHDEACYDEAGELVCEITEHSHNQDCTTEQAVEIVTYYCGLEEHTHGEACYDETGELVCEVSEHIHSEECTVEPVTYYCGMDEHTHNEACYDETGELICEIIEHTHSEECTVESVTYYCGLEEHTHGAACYNEAGELICEILEHTHIEKCTIQPVYLCGLEEHTHSETCYDESGILICQIPEHSHSEQCSMQDGYICGLEEHTHNENCYDSEGNFICTMPEHTHTDVCKAQNVYACGLNEHTHGEECYDAEGNLICEIPEHIHTTACIGRNLYYSDASIRVHAVIRGVENLPAKLTLKVTPITQELNPEYFGSMQVAISEQIATQEQYLGTASFYDMQLLSEDVPYTLPETASVTVTMEFTTPIFTAEDMENSNGTHAFMLAPEDGAVIPPVQTEEEILDAAEEATDPSEPSLMESVMDAITDAVSSLIPAASATEVESDSENPGEEDTSADSDTGDASADPGISYQISPLTGENYENQTQGITSVTFETNRLSTFAVALANETATGDFWERIYDTDDIVSGGTYMIVSAEGGYALGGNNNNNYQAVVYQAVKGNTEYYTISNSDNSNLRWTITASGNGYTIRNQGTSNYLYMDSVWYTNYLIYSSSKTLTISEAAAEKCMRITNGNNYLRNTGAGSFSYNSGSDGTFDDQGIDIPVYNTKDMVIFKLSETKELTIPSDVAADSTEGGSTETGPEKPDYGSFITPSGSKTGNTAVTDANDSTISVSGNYYSDPATSNLETNFRKSSYEESEAIDGKVMTDKSVIYKDDDYNTNIGYGDNTFGVTLSVLGQEYPVPQTDVVRTPIDVVYVLDVSGSMSTDDNGGDSSRAEDLVTAVNTSMHQILEDHPANRVGMVLYSSGAWDMLPLDRYTATNNEYLICKTRSITTSNGYDVSPKMVLGSSSLKNDDGVSYANAGSNAVQGVGTYTQAGIAYGYNTFAGIGTDTTYTAVIGEGEEARQYTVIRQPVFILVSDGEPTHSTNNYADVLNGPHYGNGVSTGNGNGKGIHGYNTVLSANYYKRMVSIQYQKPALFYTIGMGISSNADGPMVSTSGTGDNYKRAVLNPTPSTIALSSTKHGSYTIEMLESMLKSTYTQKSVATSYAWPDSWYGVPHEDIPVVSPNPYANNYSYADNAYFGQLSSSDLEEIFSTILHNSTTEKPYGFVLYQNTSVEVSDYIGAGMEIKGTPVLRYAGQNYTNPTVSVSGNVTTYTYHGTYQDPYIPNREPVDISDIIVTVTSEPHVPIYMCGIEAHTHDAECAEEYNGNCPIAEHTHSEEECGIYWSYLCGHHAHRPDLCYTDGVLSCDDPHIHTDSCVKITQTQKIDLAVPDTALPVYTPELIGQQYYYEALPVRLIYQLGLTTQAEAAVLDLATNGGELTFYTNRWGGAQHAHGDLLPSLVNPFYYDQDSSDGVTTVPYHPHENLKTSNPTQSKDHSVECMWGTTEHENQHLGHVYHELGNNGKLVFEAETIEIPVEKQWVNVNTDSMDPVDVTLYKVVETGTEGGGITQTVTQVATAKLNTSNDWKHIFHVPAPGENWYYAIVEAVDDKYIVTYSGETVSINIGENGEPVTAAKVTFDENSKAILTTITNAPAIELPKTGGTGTVHYTVVGMFLMAAAVLLLFRKQTCRIKRGGHTSF